MPARSWYARLFRRNENHIDEIKGVYVPFWLFDAAVTADISYTGERTRTWSDSSYDYVEQQLLQHTQSRERYIRQCSSGWIREDA